jgi:hypothetical protein
VLWDVTRDALEPWATVRELWPITSAIIFRSMFNVNINAITIKLVQVYVSDRYKFLYIRQPKSSSTAVLGAIKGQLCGGKCDKDQLRPLHIHRVPDDIWNEYLVFTFVRNPWTRILSSYKFLHSHFLRRCSFTSHQLSFNAPLICTAQDLS